VQRGFVCAGSCIAAPTGDVKRGQELFEKTYKCYACHGYDGQTGNPRLVPMNRTQEAFLAYVRKPATAQMPKFVDPPRRISLTSTPTSAQSCRCAAGGQHSAAQRDHRS
jgi:cytochrome c peroxidase